MPAEPSPKYAWFVNREFPQTANITEQQLENSKFNVPRWMHGWPNFRSCSNKLLLQCLFQKSVNRQQWKIKTFKTSEKLTCGGKTLPIRGLLKRYFWVICLVSCCIGAGQTFLQKKRLRRKPGLRTPDGTSVTWRTKPSPLLSSF